jgi:hypothetical protein
MTVSLSILAAIAIIIGALGLILWRLYKRGKTRRSIGTAGIILLYMGIIGIIGFVIYFLILFIGQAME